MKENAGWYGVKPDYSLTLAGVGHGLSRNQPLAS